MMEEETPPSSKDKNCTPPTVYVTSTEICTESSSLAQGKQHERQQKGSTKMSDFVEASFASFDKKFNKIVLPSGTTAEQLNEALKQNGEIVLECSGIWIIVLSIVSSIIPFLFLWSRRSMFGVASLLRSILIGHVLRYGFILLSNHVTLVSSNTVVNEGKNKNEHKRNDHIFQVVMASMSRYLLERDIIQKLFCFIKYGTFQPSSLHHYHVVSGGMMIDPNTTPPPSLIILGCLTVFAFIVHPDGLTWIVLGKIREGIQSLYMSLSTCIEMIQEGALYSPTIAASGSLAALFTIIGILLKAIRDTKSSTTSSTSPVKQKDFSKHKKKKCKRSNSHGHNKDRKGNNRNKRFGANETMSDVQEETQPEEPIAQESTLQTSEIIDDLSPCNDANLASTSVDQENQEVMLVPIDDDTSSSVSCTSTVNSAQTKDLNKDPPDTVPKNTTQESNTNNTHYPNNKSHSLRVHYKKQRHTQPNNAQKNNHCHANYQKKRDNKNSGYRKKFSNSSSKSSSSLSSPGQCSSSPLNSPCVQYRKHAPRSNDHQVVRDNSALDAQMQQLSVRPFMNTASHFQRQDLQQPLLSRHDSPTVSSFSTSNAIPLSACEAIHTPLPVKNDLFSSSISSPQCRFNGSSNKSDQYFPGTLYGANPVKPVPTSDISTIHALPPQPNLQEPYQNYLSPSTSKRFIPPPPGLGFPLREYQQPHHSSILKSNISPDPIIANRECIFPQHHHSLPTVLSLPEQQPEPKQYIMMNADDETYDLLNQVGGQMAISVLD